MCASDASVKDGNCSHVWVITMTNIDHLNDPLMKITGGGAVDGNTSELTSFHGELQGQTALAIITNKMQGIIPNQQAMFHMYGDNLAVQNKCRETNTSKIRHHRKANMDILEYKNAASHLPLTTHWVKSHQDRDTPWTTFDDLKALKLPMDAVLNISCDIEAERIRIHNPSHPEMSVLPAEQWAVFSLIPTPHKITGQLEEAIQYAFYCEIMQTYIEQKHGITSTKFEEIQTTQLGRYLKRLKPHERASTVKLIHRWIPTNDFLHKQGRSLSPL